MFSKHFENRGNDYQYLVGLEHRRRHEIEESIRGLQHISCIFLLGIGYIALFNNT